MNRQTLSETIGFSRTLIRTRLLAWMPPSRYRRIMNVVRQQGVSLTVGFAMAAARCPDRPGLIDERGTLTWQQLNDACDAFAAALQALPGGAPKTVGIMCRNHRGFVTAFVGASRVGADVVLLNTSFAGPALAEVVTRENITVLIYDDEFTATIDRGIADSPNTTRILGWTDDPHCPADTVDAMSKAHTEQRPTPPDRTSQLILLTSGTTGTPKGANHSGGGPTELRAILDRVPWRAEEGTVVVAPMFHAWGFGQLVFSAIMACTVVTRRKFDPEATLELIDRHQATGLSAVPVMLDRIMDLPDQTRKKYSGRSLRFVTTSGSRMRPDVVVKFMDEFGDVIYNNYNATEAGMIATATPEDLRRAPDTAGKPVYGTKIRILDQHLHEVAPGTVGTIYVHNSSQFDGYTSGGTKDFHDGFISSGDIGYLDDAGRLFVTGRDDEMIVSGGENVYPIEVEKVLTSHPAVTEAAVIGVDDDQYGHRLAAFVVLSPSANASSDELKAHVRANLANYKVPKYLIELEALPRNATGKILRNELHNHSSISS